MAPQDKKKKAVEVSPAAATSMILHAVQHSHEPVHGILVGSFQGNGGVKVTEAIPVCHGAPTQPLLETALSLLESIDEKAVVVGWYVSPRLHKDDRPGPAALKIISGLATNSSDTNKEPALLVVCNEQLDQVVQQGDQKALEASLKPLGKDFGKQWLDPLTLSLENGAAKAVQAAIREKTTVTDLVDHFQAENVKVSPWYTPAK